MRYLYFLIFCGFLLWTSCAKERFASGSDVQLAFSADTLRFDTVFTSVGSATRLLKVYNPEKNSVIIDRISIKQGSNTFFRLNVDGLASNEAEEIKIRGGDSLYIFAEVTIDPNNPLSVSPFIISDAIVFETNDNVQEVRLEAWGQNANYIPSTSGGGTLSLLSCNLGEIVWDDPKPYVIFGALIIDSCQLTIPEGARIYVHGGLAAEDDFIYNDGLILVLRRGRLVTTGTAENPVIIQGDRLETSFEDLPGQWAGIRILGGSRNNSLVHTTIKNSIVGLRVDSAATLTMESCRIFNTSSSGLIGVRATISAENCLFHSSGGNCVQIEYGGDYDFTYCTLASYGVDASALRLSNALCLDPFCSEFRGHRVNASFINSIIFGSRPDEFSFFDRINNGTTFNYQFENCVVKVDDLTSEEAFPDFFDHCSPCINATFSDALFVDVDEDDYHLDTLAVAIGQARPVSGILSDLDGVMRDPELPDIGCFEYVE